MTKTAVVIVAAGRGSRMGDQDGPKQYRRIADKVILQHTIDCFTSHPDIHGVLVVIHPDDRELYDILIANHSKLLEPVNGGETRQASGNAGLQAIGVNNYDHVLIHDAARPFVSPSLISETIKNIAPGQCALPAIPVSETIKRANAEDMVVTETVSRDGLYLAQTPQGFVYREIMDAHNLAALGSEHEFTDDAAVGEHFGMTINLVEGDRRNFKITTPTDLSLAEEQASMLNGLPDIRTGNGYDIHILGPGNQVILCGIEIPHTQSLQGHSDADVGLHALTDALLGTIGAGDIGNHFPPSDEKWKGASSDLFLAHAVELVLQQGGSITNLDVTIICETPKIGPHQAHMRARIAEICQIDQIERISVKATTNEKIGAIGRQEGIAAMATASVVFGR